MKEHQKKLKKLNKPRNQKMLNHKPKEIKRKGNLKLKKCKWLLSCRRKIPNRKKVAMVNNLSQSQSFQVGFLERVLWAISYRLKLSRMTSLKNYLTLLRMLQTEIWLTVEALLAQYLRVVAHKSKKSQQHMSKHTVAYLQERLLWLDLAGWDANT